MATRQKIKLLSSLILIAGIVMVLFFQSPPPNCGGDEPSVFDPTGPAVFTLFGTFECKSQQDCAHLGSDYVCSITAQDDRSESRKISGTKCTSIHEMCSFQPVVDEGCYTQIHVTCV